MYEVSFMRLEKVLPRTNHLHLWSVSADETYVKPVFFAGLRDASLGAIEWSSFIPILQAEKTSSQDTMIL